LPGVLVPLTRKFWLTAVGELQLQGLATAAVFALPPDGSRSVDWQPLDLCHELFQTLQADFFAAETNRDSLRLRARQQRQEQLLQGAAVHLLRTDLPELGDEAATGGDGEALVALVRVVAEHLKIPVHRVRLPRGLDPMRQDTAALRRIVRLAGMEVREVRLEDGWHRRDNGPLAGFWGVDRRPVALLPAGAGKYRLFDPVERTVVDVNSDIANQIHATALTFYVGLSGKSVSVAQWLKLMLAKCWTGDLWTILLASLAAGLIPVITPFVTQTIFEDIIPINDRIGLVIIVQVMIAAAVATAGLSFVRGVALLRVKGRAGMHAEAALWLRLLSLPTAFFRRYQAGDLAQRMKGLSDIMLLLSDTTVAAVFNLVFCFGSLLVMFWYSWQLTLAAGALLVLYFAAASLLVWRMVVARRRMTTAKGRMAGLVLQLITGLSKFRLQGAEPRAYYLWAREFGEQWKWNRSSRWKANWLEILNIVQPLLLTMVIVGFAGYWLKAAAADKKVFISLPELIAFNAALTGFSLTLTSVVSIVGNLLDIVPLVERIRPILEAEPEATEDKVEAEELTGRIEVQNVVFRYASDGPIVLDNVSLDIKPGQFVAIVGGSGSGKSTLMRLLLGFERPESGSIYYDGQDLADLNAISVRSQMGVVMQNGQLMSGTIFQNIVGALPLNQDDAWEAAEMVGLADDIKDMPMAMQTVVSDGAANISGGQRQRILIARAVVNRPRIIIFDEATSALDNKTQAVVAESLDKLKATRIVVAHRLSTVIGADIIYVMDHGRLVESGKYEQLMEHGGLFAAMARRQLA
jgi:NHLM bacteriocin system ABC transporter ATP-binding protein